MADLLSEFLVRTCVASDGYVLAFREYHAREAARGQVVCIHGIQSHAGWYHGLCQALRQAGHDTFFLDRRGSGMNSEAHGDAPSFRRLIDDLAEFIQQIRTPGPKPIPLCLLAISWGGKLAVALERRWPGLIDGLILATPGLFPKVYPPLLERLRIALARLWNPRRVFSIPLNEPELFTTSPRWLHFLREDPLALHHATARLLVASTVLDRYVRRGARRIKVPSLVLLAGRDRIIDNARTRRFVRRFKTQDLTILEYANASHTLEFEEPPTYQDDIVAWLQGERRQEGS